MHPNSFFLSSGTMVYRTTYDTIGRDARADGRESGRGCSSNPIHLSSVSGYCIGGLVEIIDPCKSKMNREGVVVVFT